MTIPMYIGTSPITQTQTLNRVIVVILPKVISVAVALAIFTALQAGFQFSSAGHLGTLANRGRLPYWQIFMTAYV